MWDLIKPVVLLWEANKIIHLQFVLFAGYLRSLFCSFPGVKTQGSAPSFTEILHPAEVKQGADVIFTCRSTGEPKPDIEWYKDGVLLQQDDRVIASQKDDVSTFTIKNIGTIDEAVYKCLARNPLGIATSEAELLVTETAVKPELLEPLKDIDTKSGQDCFFSVRVKGIVKVDWYKDEEILLDAGRVVIVDEQDGETFTLAVEDARIEDAGVYKCVAHNEAGEVTCSAVMKVSPNKRRSRKGSKDSEKSAEFETFGKTMELIVEGM